MKRWIALLLALSLACGILTACDKVASAGKLFGDVVDEAGSMFGEVMDEVTKETLFEKTGFSITLPAYTVDSSKDDRATENPYLFTAGTIILCALEQPKHTFGQILSLEEYAQLLIDSNKLDASLEQKDGLYTFTYTSEKDNLTFLCIALETENAFWYVNASCYPDLFETNREQMWKYLTGVTVTATGEAYNPITELTTATVKDLTLSVPAEGYTDMTEDVDLDMNFVYMMSNDVVVMGLREKISSLDEEYQNLDAYAQGLIDSNKLSAELQYKDGMPYFVYTSEDGQFTYIGTAHQGSKAFWFVQAYTFTERFEDIENQLWVYLTSVQVE